MCGGTPFSTTVTPAATGLSPRVRGNQLKVVPSTYYRGSIPACAGNLLEPPGQQVGLRSIPACAGEPRTANRPGHLAAVYPRVCGGTAIPRACTLSLAGLSPRVRGNPNCRSGSCLSGRSIPACAGEPGSGTITIRASKVYPRVCGGTFGKPAGKGLVKGLSPRVRGNPLLVMIKPVPRRSIPACAGEPSGLYARRLLYRVYPRVCGGTCHRPGNGPYAAGLSPRVRGNRSSRSAGYDTGGCIPACAGEPH